jgi:hypothetical protein
MSPEMKLAQALGGLPSTETEKLASKMEEMTVEELEAILKDEGVEKLALSTKTVGSALGKRAIQVVKANRPSKSHVEALMRGNDIAKQLDHAHPQYAKWIKKHPIKQLPMAFHAGGELAKKSSVEMADSWGRTLAKTAAPRFGAMVGQGLNAAMRVKPVLGMSGAATRVAGGAAMGAIGGAGSAMMSSPNPQTGQKPSMLGRAVVGAGLGAAGGAGLNAAVAGKGAIGQAARGAMKQGKVATNAAKAAKPAAAAAKAAPAVAPASGAAPVGAPAPAPQVHPSQISQMKASGLAEAEIAGRVRTGRGLPPMAPSTTDVARSRALHMQTSAQANSARNRVAQMTGGQAQNFVIQPRA